MKLFLLSAFVLFISAVSLFAVGSHSIGSWNSAEFRYDIDSEAKKIKLEIRRPTYKVNQLNISPVIWVTSLRLFTNPDINGDSTTNVEMKKFNWSETRESAETVGNAHSAYLLAHKLISKRRFGEAAYFLKTASAKSHAEAMNDLGVLALFGMGVPRNLSYAYEMFKKSSSNGCPMGNLNVGLCSMMGLGCRQNFLSAKAHLQRAANHKNPVAEAILAINHAIGTPIASHDSRKAYKLVLLARAHGFGWRLDTKSSYYYVNLSLLERYIESSLSDSTIGRIQNSIPTWSGVKSPYRKSHLNITDSYNAKPSITVIGPNTNAVINSFEDIPYMGNNTGMTPIP